ncbi:dTDP-4-dehydrorhamnose reductase [Jatrophihabitans sp. DSM 45814]
MSTPTRPLRWLVTGAAGQLGSDVQRVLNDAAHAPGAEAPAVLALGSSELDITDRVEIDRVISEFKPDVILNAAGYTAVDQAENDEARAFVVNATGPALLAAAAQRSGAKLLHISTDYVFAGDATTPYAVDEPTAPKSAYGRTKLAGEQAVRTLAPDHGFVIRTAWVYGAAGGNFVKTMAGFERSRETISVVDDQVGSPTWSYDLARGLVELAHSSAPAGVYHCTNSGSVTWHGLARAVFSELGADPARVLPTTTEAFPRPAPRPAYSVLSDAAWRAAGLTPLPDWRVALHAAFERDSEALAGRPAGGTAESQDSANS